MTTLENLTQILKANIPTLSDSEISSFLAICTLKTVQNKEAIIKPNTKSTTMFFILQGMVRGYLINPKGVEKNIFLRPEHTFIGDPIALFKGGLSKYTFEGIGETILLAFEFKHFENLALENAGILKICLSSYKEMILTMVSRIESMIDKMPEERYEDLLRESPHFFKTVYHKDIANYLGITPVSLSRIIKRGSAK
jgi:CRP-like cAMP-binding protein